MVKNNQKRYYPFSEYLKQKFGVKVYKITLDAGFSCPNRDGTISSGGCIFCDEGGSYAQTYSNNLTLKEQLDAGMKLQKERFKAQKFMSYFQAYSNTYKPVYELEKIYNSALNHPDIVGISIGTRPDCVDDEKISLISSYTNDYEVWLEYGLQSIHDKTLKRINRGHDYECFLKAYEMAKNAGINVCAHVILGMWESHDEMMQTAKELARLNIDGVKIHQFSALKGTVLAKMYERGEVQFATQEEYVKLVCDFLEYLPPETKIHRLAGNGLVSENIAPLWLGKKWACLNDIDREFEKRNSWQGKYSSKIHQI